MHSKWQLWDFLQSYPKGSFNDLKGKIVLQAFEPLALRLMKDHLLAGVEDKPKHLAGSDLTLNWLEDEFQSLGLFGNTTSYIINNPDEMNSACKDFLLRDDLLLEDRRLAFAFYSDSPYLKKMMKTTVSSVVLEAPRFWEMDKLIDFLSRFFRLPLDLEAKKLIMQAVEHELSSLYDVFRLIKLNYPEKASIGVKDVEGLIDQERLDQFALATDLAKKKYSAFFDRLLSVNFDFERLRFILSFLQGHFVRVADPSYLEGKARLSQYDKEILALSQGWTREEIKHLLLLLQNWEMDCKMKNSNLQSELRQAYLQSLKGAWKPDKHTV
jgi:DNA polymerase III delta subunit